MTHIWRLLVLAAFSVSACTRQVEVSKLEAGADHRALLDLSSEDEVAQFDWAAIDATIPKGVARSIRRWQLTNLTLSIFRCGDPEDYYPAYAGLDGKRLEIENLTESLPEQVKLTFYLPKHVKENGAYDCAALDARGYSPVFLRGQTMHLPSLHFVKGSAIVVGLTSPPQRPLPAGP